MDEQELSFFIKEEMQRWQHNEFGKNAEFAGLMSAREAGRKQFVNEDGISSSYLTGEDNNVLSELVKKAEKDIKAWWAVAFIFKDLTKHGQPIPAVLANYIYESHVRRKSKPRTSQTYNNVIRNRMIKSVAKNAQSRFPQIALHNNESRKDIICITKAISSELAQCANEFGVGTCAPDAVYKIVKGI